MRNLALVFTLALTSALTACDTDTDVQPADVAENFPLPGNLNFCGRSGGPFGPCDHNLSSPCLQGLACVMTVEGDMCVPEAVDGKLPKAFSTCKAKYGSGFSCASGLCLHLCEDTCLAGTVCAEVENVCVWPFPEGDTSTG